MTRRARVSTPKGWIEGAEERGVLAFRGIPFAQSTGGEARFRVPRRVRAWSGTLDASCFGRAAPQPGARSGPLARWSAVPPAGAGEDCLNLNIWTPAADHRRRPVLIWVHGGGFSHGSGSFHLYAGDRLARRGDVVVVTFNYRLGVFGGLDLRGLGGAASADTNFVLHDQIAALEWVQSNIEAFGGDPHNVTLFGQSAGAMSIGTLMASPRGAGLFRRGILQSGAGDNVLSVEQARRVAGILLEKLNLDAGQSDVVGALRQLDSATLLRAQLQIRSEHGLPLGMLAWQPVIDGDLVPGVPRARFEAGEAIDVPILIGTNRDEWKMFTATDKKRRTLDEGTLRKYLTQTFVGSRESDSTDVAADIAGASLGRNCVQALGNMESNPNRPRLPLPGGRIGRCPRWPRCANLVLPLRLETADCTQPCWGLSCARTRLRIRHPQNALAPSTLWHVLGIRHSLRSNAGGVAFVRAYRGSERRRRCVLARLRVRPRAGAGVRRPRIHRSNHRSGAQRVLERTGPGKGRAVLSRSLFGVRFVADIRSAGF